MPIQIKDDNVNLPHSVEELVPDLDRAVNRLHNEIHTPNSIKNYVTCLIISIFKNGSLNQWSNMVKSAFRISFFTRINIRGNKSLSQNFSTFCRRNNNNTFNFVQRRA